MKIILTIEVPEGASVHFTPEEAATGNPADVVPIPGTVATPQPVAQFVPQQVIPPRTGPAPVCPTHNASHLVPAGVSKKPGGRAYSAFYGCTVQDCKWRVEA
jgi:hypothetical protein